MARALMIQGAGSDVGKSLIVAGLARAARRRGLSVLPFKPQNMSNNAAVTVDGGEIGRAQALQALAAGVEPHTDMNPVLLKPETDVGAQIIVHGKRIATARAREYANLKPSLMGAVLESFERLKERAGLVLVEGAGSPAEVNLRKSDIANMGFARKADVPVVLIGDIDRGGVIAQLVGIKTVIDAEDAAMIQGFVINKFRGDPTLFDDGYRLIRAGALRAALRRIPADFDLQNIALTFALAQEPESKWKHLPIHFRARRGGENSINYRKIAKMGLNLLRDFGRIRTQDGTGSQRFPWIRRRAAS